MQTSRRRVVLGSAAGLSLVALGQSSRVAAQTTTLKISHQFPGGTIDRGRLPRSPVPALRRRRREAHQRRAEGRGLSGLVADEDQLAVLGAAQGRARPVAGAALVRRRRGARDQHRPDARRWCRVYEVGSAWKTAEVGKLLDEDARRQGHHHRQLDLAGRRRRQPRASRWSAPDDAKGMKVRGGSREMDMMLKEAGASVHLAALERDLRGDADRRDGRGDDVVDQLHLVQARGDRQAPDHRPQQGLLVHVRAAA